MKNKNLIKIIIIITLCIIAITSIIFIIICSVNKNINEGYHTVLESKSYVYEKDRKMTFNVYSDTYDTLIADNTNNQYVLQLNNLSYELENVEVRKYKIPESTLLKIEADIPIISDSVSSDSAKLIIYTPNKTVTLRLGTISILNPTKYKLLGVDRLYASYCIVDGYKQLVGINIKFKEHYDSIEDFKLGEYAIGNLRLMTNENYDNEINIQAIIPSYNIYRVERVAGVSVNKDSYFIPINYISLMLIRESYISLRINNENYYIDTFSFMTNDLSYEEYKNIMKDGEIK